MDTDSIAVVAATLLGILALFQVALALGLAAGRIVFGGRVAGPQGRLPWPWRFVSGVAAVVLAGFAWVVLARAGVIATGFDEAVLAVLSWMVVAYLAISTAGNAMAKEPVERYLFGAISGILVVLCAIVAAAGPS